MQAVEMPGSVTDTAESLCRSLCLPLPGRGHQPRALRCPPCRGASPLGVRGRGSALCAQLVVPHCSASRGVCRGAGPVASAPGRWSQVAPLSTRRGRAGLPARRPSAECFQRKTEAGQSARRHGRLLSAFRTQRVRGLLGNLGQKPQRETATSERNSSAARNAVRAFF